jgi:hypothetical protein
LTKRLSHGFSGQTSYTWSKNLGLSDTDHDLRTRDPGNRSLDKALLGFHRSHVITGVGTYALPFGAGRALFGGAPQWVQNLVGQWQLGGLFRWNSGAPMTLSAGGLANVWQQTNNTPHLVGELPEPVLTFFDDGRRPTYFPGLTQGSDPGRAALPATDRLNLAGNNRAIFDAQGNPVLINPASGDVGSLGLRTIEGPSLLQLDMNLQKRVQIDERLELELRTDVTNILNHPVFNAPTTNINSTAFGQISGAQEGRKFTMGARLNF